MAYIGTFVGDSLLRRPLELIGTQYDARNRRHCTVRSPFITNFLPDSINAYLAQPCIALPARSIINNFAIPGEQMTSR
jgi:hypothetical protein